jgi:hypothetical protein
MTTPRSICLLTAALPFLLTACHDARELNHASATRALESYLDRRGDLCLAKNAWPVDVTEAESRAGSRNALQMPVLERLGLVTASDAQRAVADADGVVQKLHARRYALTATGREYYLARPPRKAPSGNRFADAGHDLCAARLSLDTVVGWQAAPRPGGVREAVVTYTYRVAAAPWTHDAAARAVFPMVDAVIRGERTARLTETLVLGPGGWEAKDL